MTTIYGKEIRRVITYKNKDRKLLEGAIIHFIGDVAYVRNSGSDWTTSGTTIYERKSIRVPRKHFVGLTVAKLKNKKGYYKVK